VKRDGYKAFVDRLRKLADERATNAGGSDPCPPEAECDDCDTVRALREAADIIYEFTPEYERAQMARFYANQMAARLKSEGREMYAAEYDALVASLTDMFERQAEKWKAEQAAREKAFAAIAVEMSK
jgi:hypothetical protein